MLLLFALAGTENVCEKSLNTLAISLIFWLDEFTLICSSPNKSSLLSLM